MLLLATAPCCFAPCFSRQIQAIRASRLLGLHACPSNGYSYDGFGTFVRKHPSIVFFITTACALVSAKLVFCRILDSVSARREGITIEFEMHPSPQQESGFGRNVPDDCQPSDADLEFLEELRKSPELRRKMRNLFGSPED